MGISRGDERQGAAVAIAHACLWLAGGERTGSTLVRTPGAATRRPLARFINSGRRRGGRRRGGRGRRAGCPCSTQEGGAPGARTQIFRPVRTAAGLGAVGAEGVRPSA